MEAEEFAVREMSPDSCAEFGTDGLHELLVSLALCSLQSCPGPARGAGVDLQVIRLLTALWGQTSLALVFEGYQSRTWACETWGSLGDN